MKRNSTEVNRSGRPNTDTTGDGSWPERALVLVSTVFTLTLFAYVLWQGAMTPDSAAPTASVSDVTPLTSGDVRVTVVLQNGQNVGLTAATVTVECDMPPPALTFEQIPADDSRTGFVLCPAGTDNPTVTVSSWVEV